MANGSGRRDDAFCHRAHVSEVSDYGYLWRKVPSRQGCQIQVATTCLGLRPSGDVVVTFSDGLTIVQRTSIVRA